MSKATEPTWSDIAAWYDKLVTAGSGPHQTALRCTLELAGDVRGQVVADLACGQGLAARALAESGAAEVVGIDSSETMLDLARSHAGPPVLRYTLDDAQSLATLGDESLDGVVCQLALMDIPDLAAALRSVRRVLRPGGWFVFVVGHPCVLTPDGETLANAQGTIGRWSSDYFTERFWRSSNPQGVRRAGNHHRTLSTYLNGLIAAGFVLERVAEPRASALLASQQPEYASMPMFWAARARAPSAG